MERYNPFASDLNSSLADGDNNNNTTNPVRRQVSAGSSSNVVLQNNNNSSPKHSSRYSTSFPDPFATDADPRPPSPPPPPPPLDLTSISSTAERILSSSTATQPTTTSNRSNSVTFLDKLSDDSPRGRREMATAESPPPRRPIIQRGATTSSRSGGGLGSFLSRATSVTSNSVSGAMGSVRNAVVDSISTATAPSTPASQRSAGGDQSTASYLASKFSSATNQLVGGTSSATMSQTQLANSTSLTTSPFAISRQRVVLILDSPSLSTSGSDHWPAQFAQYRRLLSGQTGTSNSLAFTAFFASQFSSQLAGGGQQAAGEGDLIEQADLADVSVLANQSSSTAAVFISGPSAQVGASTGSGKMIIPASFFGGGGGASGQTAGEAASQLVNSLTAAKIVRPEFVVVRQRARADKLDHLRDLVSALHYCCVPMFEPYECWHVFQDRVLIFGRLLRVQMALGGKEHFPLIPQLYCQTHQDLVNYIGGTGAAISLPCLVRTGPQGKGKLRVESLQMLREFATIMATSGQSCTIEQQLDVKCDLIVQKLGTSLKLFRRQVAVGGRKDSVNVEGSEEAQQLPALERQSFSFQQPTLGESSSGLRQSASRQTSVGVLSSIISSTSSGLQQVAAGATRRTSNPNRDTVGCQNQFEKLSEVNGRYRDWMEAIAREFNYKLDAFCLKIVVTTSDREYIVGLRNCSMDFLGSSENQDEDRRSFVELIISKMNTLLSTGAQDAQNSQPVGRTSSGGGGEEATQQRDKSALFHQHQPLGSMARYSNDSSGTARVNAYGQLNNRSRSVSMNQAQSQPNINKTTILPNGSSTYHSNSNSNNNLSRRSSERADSTPSSMKVGGEQESNNIDLMQQRQSSLGQSIFDQTSTAFSSFQNKSLSFLKRLDSRTGTDLIASSSPLQTAKSLADQSPTAPDHHPIKSQSLETTSSSSLDGGGGTRLPRAPPPKPPPPPPSSLISRQSSLAANYSTTSSSSPPPARQNSATTFASSASGQQQPTTTTTTTTAAATRQSRVVRQNSALSAFEPFDPELRGESSTAIVQKSTSSQARAPTTQSDNISTISANSSNSTDDTNASAEDTMNNLKKTFASIFGDKCD